MAPGIRQRIGVKQTQRHELQRTHADQPVAPMPAITRADAGHMHVDPRGLNPRSMRALQHTLGNQHIARMVAQMSAGASATQTATVQRSARPAGPIQPPVASGDHVADTVAHSASTPAAAPLASAVRGTMEGAFARSFSDVTVHADSPQASGSTLAFTQGKDVHFAPGHYQPGTSAGNWLIAHELAHVVQQNGSPSGPQRFDQAAPSLGHEADADQAANAAVAHQPAVVHTAARAGARQSYEAWEHRALGDAGGGAARTVTVDCGITLTYGQVVALSGDFYRSPEALMHAPRPELEAILRTMDRERTQAGATPGNAFGTGAPTQDQINQNNADYEMATTGPGSRASHHDDDANPFLDDEHHEGGPDAAHPHGTVTSGGHVEDNGPSGGAAPSAEDTFLGLADNNASHFSPENINLNFKPKHQLAIDLAKEAWQARNPGATPGSPSSATHAAPPTGAAAAAASPAAASEPVPTGAATPTAATVSTQGSARDPGERKEAMAILSDGFAVHFLTDAFASGHLVSGSVGRTIGDSYYSRHAGQVALALTACLVSDYPAASIALGPGGVAAVIAAASGLISSKAGSLTLKLVHDYFNQHGVTVRNPIGTEWTTVGDANLASSPITQQQGALAATASREGIDKAVHEGTLSDADRDKPLKYVPDQAKFASGSFQTIDAFCSDVTIFDAVLSETMLASDPATNKLWQLIKGNVSPMIMLKLRQGGRWIGDLADGVYEFGARGVRAIADEAVAIGGAIRDRASAAGDAIADGASAAGDAIADRTRGAAQWVESLFD